MQKYLETYHVPIIVILVSLIIYLILNLLNKKSISESFEAEQAEQEAARAAEELQANNFRPRMPMSAAEIEAQAKAAEIPAAAAEREAVEQAAASSASAHYQDDMLDAQAARIAAERQAAQQAAAQQAAAQQAAPRSPLMKGIQRQQEYKTPLQLAIQDYNDKLAATELATASFTAALKRISLPSEAEEVQRAIIIAQQEADAAFVALQQAGDKVKFEQAYVAQQAAAPQIVGPRWPRGPRGPRGPRRW